MKTGSPTEYRFATIPQFLEIIQSNQGISWVYRGQDNISWPLCPKAGRSEYFVPATSYWEKLGQASSDLGRFSEWREEAVAFSERIPENDFEALAFAQHYGLATRLLDWTNNPLVALFFAVESQGETDGAVFCHFRWVVIDRGTAKPHAVNQVALFQPRPFDRRILAQSGVFTFHPKPNEPLRAELIVDVENSFAPDKLNLVVIRVEAGLKQMLQRQLSELGIDRKTLFPDLEGLSAFVNWSTRRSARYKNDKL